MRILKVLYYKIARGNYGESETLAVLGITHSNKYAFTFGITDFSISDKSVFLVGYIVG